MLVFYYERQAQATRSARKGADAVIGQPQYFHHTPIARPGEMHHRLPQLGLSGRMFDEIDLVDDIDQVLRFGDAPEHLIDAHAQFPFAVADFAE